MKYIFSLFTFVFLYACSSNSTDTTNCNYLLNISVNYSIDLNLPQYSSLNFAGNSIYIPNIGNAGIIIASTGANFYAWDASDPNHTPSSCSALIPNGLFGTCGCGDENTYNFVTGTPENNSNLRCALQNYRIEKTGNTLTVYN